MQHFHREWTALITHLAGNQVSAAGKDQACCAADAETLLAPLDAASYRLEIQHSLVKNAV